MAHFAEVNSYGLVLRVVVIDNNDVNANGGDQSSGAEEAVKKIVPFTSGSRWIQTSYNNNFRKQYAGIGYTFDSAKNKFIAPQPFASWSLDSNDDWQAPVAYPTVTTYGDNAPYMIIWDEANKQWTAQDSTKNIYNWVPSSSSWVATGKVAS